MNLDDKIQRILRMEIPGPGEPGMPGAIRDLIADCLRECRPERLVHTEDLTYSPEMVTSYNHAVQIFESKAEKLLAEKL